MADIYRKGWAMVKKDPRRLTLIDVGGKKGSATRSKNASYQAIPEATLGGASIVCLVTFKSVPGRVK